jgi:hypothetical protein
MTRENRSDNRALARPDRNCFWSFTFTSMKVCLFAGLLILWCTPAFASFTYKGGPFTVQSGRMPSSQTNFPFCIFWQNNALKTTNHTGGQVTDAQGDDIVPHSDSALTTRYNDFQMVAYDGDAGTLEMCIRATGGVGTTIYLGIGDTSITSFQGSAAAVWDSNFKAVYHLNAGGAQDSTSNSAHGSVTGATAATGKVGGGLSFSGGTDKVDIGDLANANFGTDALTVSFWLKTSESDPYVVGKRSVCAHESFWNMALYSGHLLLEIDQDPVGTNYGGAMSSNTVNDNAWHYLVATRSGPAVIVYVDGANAGSGGTTTTADLANTGSLLLGSNPCGALVGQLDEVRISKGIARSADWIASEYNNMANMAAFWGTPTFAPVGALLSLKEYIYLGDRILAVETTNVP